MDKINFVVIILGLLFVVGGIAINIPTCYSQAIVVYEAHNENVSESDVIRYESLSKTQREAFEMAMEDRGGEGDGLAPTPDDGWPQKRYVKYKGDLYDAGLILMNCNTKGMFNILKYGLLLLGSIMLLDGWKREHRK
jgi:hypothetical protein